MLANRIFYITVMLLGIFLVPLQLFTTFILGILVTLTFGLLLIPISLFWNVLSLPLIAASWVTAKVKWLRNPIGILGIPWALIADIYVTLMPSMGEIHNRSAKMMMIQSWPYTWEFWKFWGGDLDLNDPKNKNFSDVVTKISRGVPVLEQTVDRLNAGEFLDPHIYM